jgi:tRNA A37 N6-isopentenylltransferase MiaA
VANPVQGISGEFGLDTVLSRSPAATRQEEIRLSAAAEDLAMTDLVLVIDEAEAARKRLDKSFRRMLRTGKIEEIAALNRELLSLRWHLKELRRINGTAAA